MLEKIHEHLLQELRTNTRTDTIFVIVAIVFNFIVLAVNMGISHSADLSERLIMMIFVALLIIVNLVAEIGLIKGKQSRVKLLNGLSKMYEENNVIQYYDKSLLNAYKTRYNLFMLVVLCTGLVAIVVPFVSTLTN